MFFLFNNYQSPSSLPIEMVERKWLGHPDTLADMLAEVFSNRYTNYGLKHFGILLNHWVDKVLLSWWEAEVNYDNATITKNMRAYLLGKITSSVWGHTIPIKEIFEESIAEVFHSIFGPEILKYIDVVLDINEGVGLDHPLDIYKPKNKEDFVQLTTNYRSNDTIICSSYYQYTVAEQVCIDLENTICGELFKREFPATGWDSKVLTVRVWKHYDITACIPFIANRTSDFNKYKKEKEKIADFLNNYLANFFELVDPGASFSLYINTKDYEEYGYVTVFWTALDKWDYGAVGRGNKFSWVISNNRDTNIEAISGKSAFRHGWKIYTYLSYYIAKKIWEETGSDILVQIATQNGKKLDDPMIVSVSSSRECDSHVIKSIVEQYIANVYNLPQRIISLAPIKEHRQKSFFSLN